MDLKIEDGFQFRVIGKQKTDTATKIDILVAGNDNAPLYATVFFPNDGRNPYIVADGHGIAVYDNSGAHADYADKSSIDRIMDFAKEQMEPKLEEVEKIYFDMDGVLANFDKGVKEILGIDNKDEMESREFTALLWSTMKDGHTDFFQKLDIFEETAEVFHELKEMYGDKIEILTGIPKAETAPNAASDKMLWIREKLDGDVVVNAVRRKDKQLLAHNKNCVLIDDFDRNINEWNKAGGTGILFRSANELRKELNSLGIPCKQTSQTVKISVPENRERKELTEKEIEKIKREYITEPDKNNVLITFIDDSNTEKHAICINREYADRYVAKLESKGASAWVELPVDKEQEMDIKNAEPESEKEYDKPKVYVHYGSDYFDANRLMDDVLDRVKNGPKYNQQKPTGLWASPEKADFGWKEWCEEEQFRHSDFSKSFKFTLAKDANILEIHSYKDIEPYTKIPEYLNGSFNADIFGLMTVVNMDKLRSEYDGCEYFHEDVYRSGGRQTMLYSWDCDSICVWNPDVIQELEKEQVKTYYHATGIENAESIAKNGLTFQKDHNYNDSRDDRIYLADDEDVAISYAETSEKFDEIAVFSVSEDDLDKNALSVDHNVILEEGEEPHTFEYAKEIPPEHLVYENSSEKDIHNQELLENLQESGMNVNKLIDNGLLYIDDKLITERLQERFEERDSESEVSQMTFDEYLSTLDDDLDSREDISDESLDVPPQ